MKMQQLLEIFPAMQVLNTLDMPAPVSLRVGLAMKEMLPKVQEYEEQQNKLLAKLGTPIEGTPGSFALTDENAALYSEQISGMADVGVTIALPRITLADLGDVKVKPVHLAALSGVVLFDTPPDNS